MEAKLKSLRILLLEKSDVELNVLRSCLKDNNIMYETSGVNDAMNIMEHVNPDMIIVDLDVAGQSETDYFIEFCSNRLIPLIIIINEKYDIDYCIKNLKNVFSYLKKPFGETELSLSVSIAWNRYREFAESKIALENRKIIERAKGVLMDEFGLKEKEAMVRLQKLSKDKNRKLIYVANDIINAQKRLIS